MIAVVEDNDADYYLYQQTFLKDVPHHRYNSLDNFIGSDTQHNCVLLDLNLPDGFGIELIREVRTAHNGDVIVLTGLGGGRMERDVFEGQGVLRSFFKRDLINPNYLKDLSSTLKAYNDNN